MTAAKKVLAGAAALVLLVGVGGFAAMQMLRQRVIADVEKQFDGLRTVFAKAEHGAVDVDPWSKTAKIADIRLVPKDAVGDRVVTIASVTAYGAASVNDTVSAERLEFKDIVSSIPFIEQAGAETKHTVPSALVDGFAMRPIAAGSPQSSVAARLLRALSAKTVTVPKFTINIAVTAPQTGAKGGQPPVTARIEQTQFDSRIEDLRDGRMAKFTVGRMEMAVPMQPPMTSELKVEMRDLQTAGYDIGAFLAAIDGDIQGKSPAAPLILAESASIGQVTGKIDKAMTFTLAGATMGKFSIDAAKLGPAWQVFKGMQAAGITGPAALQQQSQMITAMANVYESIGMTGLEYRGLTVDVAGMAPFKLGKVAVESFDKGTLGKLSIDDLDGALPTREVYQLRHFGLKGFKIAELLRVSGKLAGGVGSPAMQSQQVWEVLKLIEGFEIDGLKYPDKASRKIVTVERLAADWGTFVGKLPLSGRYETNISVPVDANPSGPFAALGQTGLSTASIVHSGSWSWQEPAQTLVVGPIDVKMAGVGEASSEIRLEGVTRQMLSMPPELMALSLGDVRLGPATLTMRDTGLTKLLAKDPAFEEKRRQLVQSLLSTDPIAAAEPPEMAEIKAGVARFVDNPGQRLVVEMKPKSWISLGELMSVGKTGPELLSFLAARMNPTVSVRPTP